MAERNVLIRNELLCYVQCHLNRSAKAKIFEGAGRAFSDDNIVGAKDVLDREFGDNLKVKMKTRRNGQNKLRADLTLDDIVNAMIDLNQNEIVINFGARDVLVLPKEDTIDLDSYTLL